MLFSKIASDISFKTLINMKNRSYVLAFGAIEMYNMCYSTLFHHALRNEAT